MIIAVLIILNSSFWFVEPYMSKQIISWLFLLTSLILVAMGYKSLVAIGKPHDYFENTTKLVNVGIYRYIRHPMYASALLLAMGAFLKNISIISVVLTSAAALFFFFTARTEEHENMEKFGETYSEYMQNTKMFIPYLF